MSECQACIDATQTLTHEFRANCKGCAARTAARSPMFHEASRAGVITQSYATLIKKLGVSHTEVKQAKETDFLGRKS